MAIQNSSRSADAFKLPSWLIIPLILIGFVFAAWNKDQPQNTEEPKPQPETRPTSKVEPLSELSTHATANSEKLPLENEPSIPEIAQETKSNRQRVNKPTRHVEHAASATANTADSWYKIENQSIHDRNGNVAYQGTIDLKPTLDRIGRGEANRHKNDGTSFQNREGRLPRKPQGYYREYVHPTPGENGPGPQRIIIGDDGDIWYTPDHYKSFKEIKTKSS